MSARTQRASQGTERTDAPLAVFAGGGSGGHVFPGLAVARELEERGWRAAWIGSRHGMESRLLEERGVEYHGLAARPVVGRGLFGRLRAGWTLLRSAVAARGLLRRLGAAVVVGTGGYVSAPAVLGARLAGVPVVLVEPNAEPGAANRFLSRWAAEACLGQPPETETGSGVVQGDAWHCPVTHTGVPVRSEFFAVAPHLPFGEPLRVLVLGGSQGALQINRLLPEAVAALRRSDGLGPLWILHQAGARHVGSAQDAWAEAGVDTVRTGAWRPEGETVQVKVRSFLDDVAGAMAESHLVVSRAGAITLAEICAAGRPSLLLPLALAGGHQEANALRLRDAGCAEVISPRRLAPNETTGEAAAALQQRLGSLLADARRLQSMADAARRLGRPDAAREIADRVVARSKVPERNRVENDAENGAENDAENGADPMPRLSTGGA